MLVAPQSPRDPPTTASKNDDVGGGGSLSLSAKGGADGSERASISETRGASAAADARFRTGKNGFLMYAFAYPSRRWSTSSFFAFAGAARGAGLSGASPFADFAKLAFLAAVSTTAARRPVAGFDDAGCGSRMSEGNRGAPPRFAEADAPTFPPTFRFIAPSVPSSFLIFSSTRLVSSLFSSSAAARASNATLRLSWSPSAACRTSLAKRTFIADHSSHFHASFPSRSMTARRSPRVMRSTCATLCSASVASSDEDVWGGGTRRGEAVSGIRGDGTRRGWRDENENENSPG